MLHVPEPLSYLRHQARRLAAQVELDPARGQPAAVMPVLSHIVGDVLGWTPATQVSILPSIYLPGCVEAHVLTDSECPDLLVSALDHLRPQNDDKRIATARELGARWLVESNVAEWRLTDTHTDAPGFVCRIEDDNGMRLLLSALTYDEGTEQRLEQVATIGKVLSFQPQLLHHLLTHERGYLMDVLMAIAAKTGVAVDPAIARPVLMESMLGLDLIGTMLKDAPGTLSASWLSRPDDGHPQNSSVQSGNLASGGGAHAPTSAQESLRADPLSDRELECSAEAQNAQDPLVSEMKLKWKQSRKRKWIDVDIRARKVRGLPIHFILRAGSTVLGRFPEGVPQHVKDARRYLEARTGLIGIPGSSPPQSRTATDVIFTSLGALRSSIIGQHMGVKADIIDAETGMPVSVADIKEWVEAAEMAATTTTGEMHFKVKAD